MPCYLLDTNLLRYAYDGREPQKQARALALIEHLDDELSAALNAQNLAEVANVALKRLELPLSAVEVSEQLELLEQLFMLIPCGRPGGHAQRRGSCAVLLMTSRSGPLRNSIRFPSS